ncbi:hypothetical protein BIU90_15790 [Curtobacterium sp. MCBA15_001]|nr:hypothetical protein BIU90_15790 [Curtobacterium sp. MCBA15_001]
MAALVVAAVATGAAWYRLGPVTRATVWAEDGGIFFRDRLAFGADGSLFRPYAGYLHLLPRLVVDLGFARPVDQYAVTVAGACCVVVGVVAAAVFVLARDLVPAWPLRLVLAAVPVAVPVVPVEISGNAANLHWFMLLLVPWVFAARVRSWWGSAVLTLLALVAVLTEPQTLLFAPLLVVGWLRTTRGPEGSRLRALPVSIVTAGAGAAQVVCALTVPRLSPPGDPTVRDVVHGWLLIVVPSAWTRQVGTVADAIARHGWWVLVVPLVGMAVLVAAALVVGSWWARVQVLAFGLGSFVVWTAALVANLEANGHWGEVAVSTLAGSGSSRYSAASAVLLTSGVVLAAAVVADRRSWAGGPRSGTAAAGSVPRVTRAVAGAAAGVLAWGAIAVVVAAAVTSAVPGVTQRSNGPAWAPQVHAGEPACRADPGVVLQVRTAPWGTDVPCALVLR